jgi:hypothetical protein
LTESPVGGVHPGPDSSDHWYAGICPGEFSSCTQFIDSASAISKNLLFNGMLDKDFNEAEFSPMTYFTVGDDVDTLGYGRAKTGTGLEVGIDGNIIASYAQTVYKINYKTGEAMAKIVPFGSGSTSITSPDKDGNFCVAAVAAATPIKKYNKNFQFLSDAIDTVYGFSRSFEYSPDGKTIYWTSFTNKYIISYHIEDEDFGSYKDKIDTLFADAEFSVGASDWDPITGNLWFCAGPSASHSPADTMRRHMFYAYNPTSGQLVDSVRFEGLTAADKAIQHYSMTFSVGGDTLWLSMWDSKTGVPNYQYWTRNPIGTEDEPNIVATSYSLAQNYPNPFNPSTMIKFNVAKAGFVSLKVYNTLGQEVATLVNENLGAGEKTVRFNGANLASGTYIYRLNVNGVTLTNKMMLVK